MRKPTKKGNQPAGYEEMPKAPKKKKSKKFSGLGAQKK